MPRPRKRRCLGDAPPATMYKPQGVPMGQLKGVVLTVEGFEALRLVDAQGLSQEEAAERMGVSRPTVCRILGEARTVVARALSNGWAIRIEPDAEDAEAGEGRHGHPGRHGRGACHGRGKGCSQEGTEDQSLQPKEDL